MNEYVIEMLNITKKFPGILANDDVTLQLRKGEVHALLGENGAGKSTLMSVLFGLYQPDAGVIKKDGQVVQINNPNDANRMHIGMVHQHFKLVEVFTVLENIILGAERTKNGILQKREPRAKVLTLCDQYGLQVDPDAMIEDISVGMQQRVEILKMLFRDNEILIFDEPTAVLTPQEVDELMQTMRGFAREGKSILFITHKLNEIMAVADRVTVLRKGKCVGTVDVADTSVDALAEMMVGRKVSFDIPKGELHAGKAMLRVQNLSVAGRNTTKNKVNDISFMVRAGEIVGVAGIDGNGQSELVYALTGLIPATRGHVYIGDQEVTGASVRAHNNLGLSHIPEDRHKHGLVLDYSLAYNLVLKSYFEPQYQRHGFLRFDAVRMHADDLIQRFDIRSGQGADTIARSMSGGNQQKAIVARELDLEPNVLIAVQPTRGLDVGAIEYIHQQIVAARDAGRAVLLVSLELDEVMSLSDRILVMHEGELVAEVDAKYATAQELGLYMSGANKQQITTESEVGAQ
ncbi:MAG: ABC transporter ATP-binding protein [Candidatus Limiplasma sp.]|nr:ABC transporter ATP-binding protein [Candidatus Limiplasma sp.]